MAPDAHPAKARELVIRALEPSDAANAVALSRVSLSASLWPEASYRFAPESGSCGWAAFEKGEFAGFLIARCAADEAEILNLAVALQLRRRGLAAALFHAALAEFRKRGIRRVFLEVRESNLPAIRLYEKLGFFVTSRRPAYYTNPSEAALVLSLDLTASTVPER
jgi:ribosomal-protein-alanine N-acetyltransferase